MASDPRIKQRCEIIEKAFSMYVNDIRVSRDKMGNHIIDMLDVSPDPTGLTMSPYVLYDAVRCYFNDLERYKRSNGFGAEVLANPIKVGAFSAFWLANKCPIYDSKNTGWAPLINSKFAIYAGFTFADIDPDRAGKLGNKSLPLKQLDQILSNRSCTSDSLVPIFQLFKLSC
jgi:hypothetical protein